jgi:hypothetical protein
MNRRGEGKPGRKQSVKRLATKFPRKRKNRIPLLNAGYAQKRLTAKEWDRFHTETQRSPEATKSE